MPKTHSEDSKRRALREQACLNSRPQEVRDELFLDRDFFDPEDLVQVKYEMLRRVQQDGHPVTKAAAAFGFSRPSFYQAQSAFEQEGLVGLAPRKRGPKRPHKLTEEVVEFVEQRRRQDPALRAPALADLIEEKFGTAVHPRSVERSLARTQKKRLQRR
jgi:transposase